MILAVVEVVVERLDAYTIHALYMCAKSNVCILCTSWSISGSLIQRWPRVHLTGNILHSLRVAHFTSASLMYIKYRLIILDHVLV